MPDNDAVLHALQRMSSLLALVAVKGSERKDAVLMLTHAGYAQGEICKLLDLKPSAVGMILLRAKSETERAKKPKKGPRTGVATTDGDAE